MSLIVRHEPEHIAAARACARVRLLDAKASGATDRFGSDSESSHFWGALGEIAAACALRLRWSCSSRVWAVEDIEGYEVRSIPPGTDPYLKAKPNDPDDRRVILVEHRSESLSIIDGWATIADIKRAAPLTDPGNRGAPCHMTRDLRILRPLGVTPVAP
jgi:hypothetical protein